MFYSGIKDKEGKETKETKETKEDKEYSNNPFIYKTTSAVDFKPHTFTSIIKDYLLNIKDIISLPELDVDETKL